MNTEEACKIVDGWRSTERRSYIQLLEAARTLRQALAEAHDGWEEQAKALVVNHQIQVAKVMVERDAALACVEKLERVVDRYRYATAFAGADAWDGGMEVRRRFSWASAFDDGGQLSNNQIAEIGSQFLDQESHKP